MDKRISNILLAVQDEVVSAMSKYPRLNSAHEGYAVILEELDELWEEIKNNKRPDTLSRQWVEASQVAAMAVRYMLDVNDTSTDNGEGE